MAGGPIFAFSSEPGTSGKVFPWRNIGATNSRIISGMGVIDSLDANANWFQLFRLPSVLPTGTATLVYVPIAVATTGVAKVNPTWESVSPNLGNYDTVTLVAEGVQTITWNTGDSEDFKETKVTLDAGTITAGNILVLNNAFETASWTLAVRSLWNNYIQWE